MSYSYNPLRGLGRTFVGLFRALSILFVLILCHTLDLLFYLINIFTLPILSSHSTKTTRYGEWKWDDRAFASVCGWMGWGKVSNEQIQSLLGKTDQEGFHKPEQGFSRSPCPGLNALANHGTYSISKSSVWLRANRG
jgi:Peroxidase, family 2